MPDISAGSVGTPAGFTTLIVRSHTGKGFVDSAVAHQLLSVSGEVDLKAVEKLAGAKIAKTLKK